MSYAAESYPYIARQVLTALTGGAARETHRFLAVLNASGFSTEFPADDRVPESLSVAGISAGAFRVFEEGLDFQVSPDGKIRFFPDEQDALSPAAESAWPDEGSEFFVSYDHSRTGDALLTDRNPGSLTRTLAESFGRELAVLRKQMENIYRSAYLDTAEGPSLDKVVALLGVERKSREHASGTARFFRDSPAPADIFIPEATRVSTATNPPALFETTAPRMLRRGQLSVEVDVRCRDQGPQGRGGRRRHHRDEPDPAGRGRRDQRGPHPLRQRRRRRCGTARARPQGAGTGRARHSPRLAPGPGRTARPARERRQNRGRTRGPARRGAGVRGRIGRRQAGAPGP